MSECSLLIKNEEEMDVEVSQVQSFAKSNFLELKFNMYEIAKCNRCYQSKKQNFVANSSADPVVEPYMFQ